MNNQHNKKFTQPLTIRRLEALAVIMFKKAKQKGILQVLTYILWEKGIDTLGKLEDLKNLFEYLT